MAWDSTYSFSADQYAACFEASLSSFGRLKNAVYRGIHGIITAMTQWETYLTIFFFREDVVAQEVVEESVNVASE